jgi:hypothetical protein
MYFVFQICLGMIWLFDFFSPFVWTKHVAWLPFGTYVERIPLNEKANENNTAVDGESPGVEVFEYAIKTRNNAPTTMGFLLAFVFLGSLCTTVLGTFFQIVGVYRSCICSIPIAFWVKGDYPLDISTNTALAIRLANDFWLPTGIASIVLMIITCYIGWWYQRHWRYQFNTAVKALLEPKLGSIHDPKVVQGVDPSSGLVSQTASRNHIPRKSVPDADHGKNVDTDDEITAAPKSDQGHNDHTSSNDEHISIDDPGDG